MKMRHADSDMKHSQPAAVGEKIVTAQAAPSRPADRHASLQAAIDLSPRVMTQRRAIQAAFGSALQLQADGLEDDERSDARSGAGFNDSPAASADAAVAPLNDTGMPNSLKAGIEALSGMDMTGVRVLHNSDKPAQLNALAYARGNEIHLGPGQEQHLPHEAWHVVQQAQGRVRPTLQLAGVEVNDDEGLEREADLMGAEALMATGGRASSAPPQLVAMVSGPLQRIVIDEMSFNKREGEDDDSLEFGDMFRGDSDVERLIIDEYMEREPGAEFDHNAAWKAEIKLRAELIEGMRLINAQGLFNYNWEGHDWSMPADWEVIRTREGGRGQDAAFKPRANVSRSAAVRQLFREPAEDESYYFDCSTAILAVHYRALVEVMESNQAGSFDGGHDANAVVITSTGVSEVNLGHGMVEPPGNALTEEVKVTDVEKLLPGDWVYFQSFTDYNDTHEGAEAAWAGEHALYLGDDRYQGFGTASLTYQQMVTTLIDQYNNQGRKAGSQKKQKTFREEYAQAIGGELPGIVDVRRAKNPLRR